MRLMKQLSMILCCFTLFVFAGCGDSSSVSSSSSGVTLAKSVFSQSGASALQDSQTPAVKSAVSGSPTATYNPANGQVVIPQLQVSGDTSGATYSVEMMPQGSFFAVTGVTPVGTATLTSSMATFAPSTGLVVVPFMVVAGDTSGAQYTVSLQQQGGTLNFSVANVALVYSMSIQLSMSKQSEITLPNTYIDAITYNDTYKEIVLVDSSYKYHTFDASNLNQLTQKQAPSFKVPYLYSDDNGDDGVSLGNNSALNLSTGRTVKIGPIGSDYYSRYVQLFNGSNLITSLLIDELWGEKSAKTYDLGNGNILIFNAGYQSFYKFSTNGDTFSSLGSYRLHENVWDIYSQRVYKHNNYLFIAGNGYNFSSNAKLLVFKIN